VKVPVLLKKLKKIFYNYFHKGRVPVHGTGNGTHSESDSEPDPAVLES
jgi:hypothetical protein